MLWETPIIPKILIMGQQNATMSPGKREHSVIIAAVELHLPDIYHVQTIPLEEFNGARAEALIN